MGIETAGFISELVATNPVGAVDDYATADDHLRLIKAVLQGQFPNFDAVAVDPTPDDLNILIGVALGTPLKARTDIVTATPPTNEAVTGGYEIHDLDGDDKLATFGFPGTSSLEVKNFMHGGLVNLRAQNDSGVNRLLFSGDPEGSTSLYFEGVKRLETGGFGDVNILGEDDLDSSFKALYLRHSDGTIRAGFYNDGGNSGDLTIKQWIDGQDIVMRAVDAGSVSQVLFRGDPDGETQLYYDGIKRTASGPSGSFSVYGDDNLDSSFKSLILRQLDGTIRASLSNNGALSGDLVLENQVHGQNVLLRAEDAGGTPRKLFEGDPDDEATMYDPTTGNKRFGTRGFLARIYGNLNVDADFRELSFSYQDGSSSRAVIGHIGDTTFTFWNQIHGGLTELRLEQADGTEVLALLADPDGNTSIYYDGNKRLSASINGTVDVFGDGNTDAEPKCIWFRHQDGTGRGNVGFVSDTLMRLCNSINSGHLHLDATNSSAATRVLLNGDPDAGVDVYYPAGNTVNLRTANESAADASSGAEVRGPDNSFHGVGYNLLPRVAITADHVLVQADQGLTLFYDEATPRTINFNDDGNIPADAFGHIRCGEGSGTLTLDAGTGVVLNYWDGAAYIAHTAAANLEIIDGSYTWWKETDTSYYIDGPGIVTA